VYLHGFDLEQIKVDYNKIRDAEERQLLFLT
jgi:hypothetical protein